MEAELVALATAGATTLVQQMATDGWDAVRRRMAAFLARRQGTADEEVLEGELEVSRADLAVAREDGDQDGVAGVTAAWRLRLRRLLSEDPAAAAELRALLDEVAPGRASETVGEVHNTISGGVQHGAVIQAGVVSGVHFTGPPHRPHPG
ncbi:hypothetical protein ACWCO0_24825 [Streptomyces tubercidicus]|uniref:Uncharacterized protein n=1 Tax=Streptomyces tubercidicus TaxID=47759 RepID=A0A640V0X4_9ACTN|nr:hypothetical protein [Streptomyces tubercidicus]WAU14802.1 hypothetical protein STRTU_005446 [Streptomyces tubercidicus]GFE40591.1 hypothetical protein Stube_52640 [Streptomyces tubercidicus]